MRKLRIIPRLDIKGENLIKGIQLEGVRVLGNPNIFAKKYYHNGADELLYMDAVASLYGRNNLKELIKKAVKDVFIPITVGGGIRSIEDAYDILRSGADKIAINTAAVKRPNLIKELSNEFGSQSIVVSIEAKQQSKFDWEVYVESGREKTGIKVFDWIKKAESLGAGEILITSVDREGTKKGFDTELLKNVTELTKLPIIASGGMGRLDDFKSVSSKANVDAVAIATVFHYNLISVQDVRDYGLNNKMNLRNFK